MELFDLVYLAAGAGALLAAVLPRLLADQPFLLLPLGAGMLLFALTLGLPAPDPVAYRAWVEHLAEAVVIISLMGAGLSLDRPVGWRRWASTWRCSPWGCRSGSSAWPRWPTACSAGRWRPATARCGRGQVQKRLGRLGFGP